MSDVAERLARKTRPARVSTRQVRLKIMVASVWSAAKVSFIYSLIAGLLGILLTFVVYWVLGGIGTFRTIDKLVEQVTPGSGFRIESYITGGQVFGFGVAMAVVTLVVGTIIGTVGVILFDIAIRITRGVLVGFQSQ